ncbi:UNVERIFIED_CONTAM: LINE-1 reverse transcriptase [Sesamum latifolium]|uniref:LINE-1 reverse transcriptase n=1 Tax=Sesamum latifolium TaxID=2727402 RepID=A0AAW2X2S4_9LAMI
MNTSNPISGLGSSTEGSKGKSVIIPDPHVEVGNGLESKVAYGANDIITRRELWHALDSLSDQIDVPWLVCGDFNAVLDDSEICGTAGDTRQSMEEFQGCLVNSGLLTLPMQGFTWHNCSYDARSLWKRLDRMVCNDRWLERWPDGVYVSLSPRTSDHSPLVLKGSSKLPRASVFRFDNYLAQSPGFIPEVQNVWRHGIMGTRMYAVTRKLKALKPVFRMLRKSKGDLSQNVLLAKDYLAIAQRLIAQDRHNGLLLHLEYCCRLVLLKATKLEQSMLQQRAKLQWLKGGDQCTRRLLGGERTNWFIDLSFLRPWARYLLSEEDSAALITPVTTAEVKMAFFDVEEDKSPGPDGYSSGFFKAAWPIIGEEVTHAILEFFLNGKLLKQFNVTLLVLIPKVQAPSRVSDFRPISCCNVLYKVITKIIVQRLRPVLDRLISPSQNAFVPGRSIGDNILLAQGYNQQHLPSRCALKVDLRKAYDTVGARGLRQGDPMSPYLFVLVMEVLHLILRQLIDQDGGFGYHWRCAELSYFSFVLQTIFCCSARLKFHRSLSFSRGFRDCKPLLKRVDERIKGWEGVNLSFAGRGHSRGGYAKVAWSQVCRPKEEGGLNIRDVLALNRALMSKHLWRIIIQDRTSIWVEWILTVRLRTHSIWTVSDRVGSWGWRKLLRLRSLILSFIEYRVGNGEMFSIWQDPWHSLGILLQHFPRGPRLMDLLVSDRLCRVIDEGQWH